MSTINIAVPAQAMSWGAACEILNSKQLRLNMVEEIRSNSTMASLINDSVFSAVSVVPRHVFVEEKKLNQSIKHDVGLLAAAYAFNKPMPTTMNSVESSPELIGALLSTTEIIQGQSVLLVGIKGGYIQAMIAQLVGFNGSVESVTSNSAALDICRERIDLYCPLSCNIEWIKLSSITDNGIIAEEFKRQEKLFHTIIFGSPVEKFPFELTTETGLLHDGGNVSVLAPVKEGGIVRYQLYLRRGNEQELRTITDFEGVIEEAC